MENKPIELTITTQDNDLYEFLQKQGSVESMKLALKSAVELYAFCNHDDSFHEGHYAPQILRDHVLVKKSKEELLKLRKQYEEQVLLYAAEFKPSECDCGIRISPEGERWFIDEFGRLGFLSLYSHYLRMVDEVLNKMQD